MSDRFRRPTMWWVPLGAIACALLMGAPPAWAGGNAKGDGHRNDHHVSTHADRVRAHPNGHTHAHHQGRPAVQPRVAQTGHGHSGRSVSSSAHHARSTRAHLGHGKPQGRAKLHGHPTLHAAARRAHQLHLAHPARHAKAVGAPTAAAAPVRTPHTARLGVDAVAFRSVTVSRTATTLRAAPVTAGVGSSRRPAVATRPTSVRTTTRPVTTRTAPHREVPRRAAEGPLLYAGPLDFRSSYRWLFGPGLVGPLALAVLMTVLGLRGGRWRLTSRRSGR